MSGLLQGGPSLAGPPRLIAPAGPARRSRVAALLLTGLLLAGLFVWLFVDDDEIGPLKSYTLVGPRPASCLRLVIGQDVSGSMRDFAVPRDLALRQLVEWAGTTSGLRDDDEIAVVDFAFEAGTRLPPASVKAGGLGTAPSLDDGTDTLWLPMLRAMDAFPATKCRTALVLLSDAQISDLPAGQDLGRQVLKEHGVDEIRLLVPGDGIQVWPGWEASFPSAPPIRFDGTDPKETALVIGETIASLTTQHLARIVVSSTPTT